MPSVFGLLDFVEISWTSCPKPVTVIFLKIILRIVCEFKPIGENQLTMENFIYHSLDVLENSDFVFI